MKWVGRRQSANVEDRRGMSGGGKAALGGGGLIVAVLAIYSMFSGNDTSFLQNLVQGLSGSGAGQAVERELTAEEINQQAFVKTILAYTEDVWGQVFQQSGQHYREPHLVIFSGATQSGCGGADAAVGPFYCPADMTVYFDMDFFQELKSKFGAQMRSKVDGEQGDFAVAYVIAHEIGHHVQNLLGASAQERQLAARARSEAEANKYSVALELQADFYAGIFTYYSDKINNMLESGDIEGAISAARAVGDDAIQSRMQGYVVPESFTHGTSEQRVLWFKKGYQTGDISQGSYETVLRSVAN
ncbi:MAG: neutral zinc metallopeptidase [Prevotellaceae bacterium]|jgi:predicted metalloprotease|nr:neutral zinc metallopeptidase [Prevotellaceae bacterium]